MAGHGLSGVNVHLSKEKLAQLLERGSHSGDSKYMCVGVRRSWELCKLNYMVPSVNISFNMCESMLHSEKLHQHRKHCSAQVNTARHPRIHSVSRVLTQEEAAAGSTLESFRCSFLSALKRGLPGKPITKLKQAKIY